MNLNRLRNRIVKFLLLMGMWLLLSGHYDFFHIALGVFSVILVIAVNSRLAEHPFFSPAGSEAHIKWSRLFLYVPWLTWQIVVSSLQVAYAVLHPRMPIDPSLIRFKTKLPTTASKVILGNSITLTPGTITLLIEDDTFLVHSLMDASFSGIASDSLPEHAALLFQKSTEKVVTALDVIKSVEEV